MPASDFSSHDPDFTPEQEAQCARIIAGLRELNSRAVRLGGSLAELTAAAERVEALLESLEPVTQTRAIETYRFQFDRDDPNGVLRFNPATGEFNPIAADLKMTLEGENLVVACEFPNCFESAPDTAQGGMVAAVFDQLLAYSIMREGFTGPTLWIKVTYLKPTPINRPLRFESQVTSVDGKKFSVAGSCVCGDERVAEAEALILGSYPIGVIAGSEDE